ncbi:MAG: hypothetical protein KDB03_28410, partial [Planctomycetales bacterium]|nr:hypothetical protein [Planctomycetales bacterium]
MLQSPRNWSEIEREQCYLIVLLALHEDIVTADQVKQAVTDYLLGRTRHLLESPSVIGVLGDELQPLLERSENLILRSSAVSMASRKRFPTVKSSIDSSRPNAAIHRSEGFSNAEQSDLAYLQSVEDLRGEPIHDELGELEQRIDADWYARYYFFDDIVRRITFGAMGLPAFAFLILLIAISPLIYSLVSRKPATLPDPISRLSQPDPAIENDVVLASIPPTRASSLVPLQSALEVILSKADAADFTGAI